MKKYMIKVTLKKGSWINLREKYCTSVVSISTIPIGMFCLQSLMKTNENAINFQCGWWRKILDEICTIFLGKDYGYIKEYKTVHMLHWEQISIGFHIYHCSLFSKKELFSLYSQTSNFLNTEMPKLKKNLHA